MDQGVEQDRVAQLEQEVAALRRQLAARTPAAARREMSKREWLLAEAERMAHLGSWTWDLRSGEVYWSDELCRILGLEPRTATASVEAFFEAVHPDDRARVRAVSTRQLEGAAPEPVHFRIIRPSGEVRQLHMEGGFSDGPGGRRQHIVGTVLDETDKHLAAALLAQTVAELNEAQQVALLGSWRWTLATGRVEWSDGMYRLLALDRELSPSEELFYQHVHPDDVQAVRVAAKRAAATGLASELELRLLRRDGAARVVVMRSRAVFDEAGALTGFVGTLQDIDERKALEEAARHAQKMDAVGTLAGGVAHDFNNYLMVLSGHLDLLALTMPEPERAKRSLDAIRYACDRCVNLTEQLLTLSRKRPPRPASFDLGKRVERLSEVLRSALGATISLELSRDPSAPPIYADPLQVEHALMNLALNARDVMPDGGTLRLHVEGVCVEQSPKQELGAGYYVRLTISDTGVGIPSELQSRIFEPFFTTKAVGKGTGLGLAMVYGIVREAGGAIEVESAPGEGTTFQLYFRPAAQQTAASSELDQPEAEVAPAGQGQRILLVEDVELVRELLRVQLQNAGYQVLTATDGMAALAMLSSHTVDGIVSDVVMPNMGGIELLRIARERYPGVPSLLMSGYAPSALGATQDGLQPVVLRKPFNSRALCSAVGELVRNRNLD